MEETILVPSPNWFLASGLAVSQDGWLIYGGPSKCLCALEPLPEDRDGILIGKHNFKAHVLNRAHPDRIVCVAISPEWPEKRDFLAGSVDGLVKQWTLELVEDNWKLKATQSHDKHHHDKEEVAGVAYSHDSYAVTVGSFGNLIKWDIKSNVVKTFRNLKGFKPTCMACSPHMPLHVAVGTKQGVIFVVDLTGAGKTVYKVRGQDDEITNLGWCPQFEVLVKKPLGEPEKKVSVATQRMMKIRHLTDEEKLQLFEAAKVEESVEETPQSEVKPESDKPKDKTNNLEDSGIVKNLPEDSFDESMVAEDDMFDIYKDHEADEFGHKKYEPEEIVVKIRENTGNVDYLAECLKLKEEILQRRNEPGETMESLVKALDDAHLDKTKDMPSTSDTGVSKDEPQSTVDNNTETEEEKSKDLSKKPDSSVHVHKHLLVSISKFGSVRLWSKSGKLVGSCAVPTVASKNVRNAKSPAWANVLWYKSDVLLIADGKSQLLECNPLKVNSKNKLDWHVVHTLHKRGLFAVVSDAPRVQPADQSYDEFNIWTASQDRNIICYSLAKKQQLTTINSCGGYIYSVQTCPYDAGKVAASVGDGAVRVWQSDTTEDEGQLTPGTVSMYWQYVKGKVLTVAWHPTRENLLAFSTAESRVGLIDTSNKSDKSTRTLLTALHGGVYALAWGEGNHLYACGGGSLVVYDTSKVDEAPTPIPVPWEGQLWEVSAVVWRAGAMLVGSQAGAVAVLAPQSPHTVLAATFVFSKIIHTLDWHPQQTSSSSEDSPLKNLIAVCSQDKLNTIVILEYVENEDGVIQLNTWKTLSGHKGVVYQVSWSPHTEGLLLSMSQDSTIRVWEVVSGTVTHTFGGHRGAALCGAWGARPGRPAVLSGGADGCLRLWDHHHYPAHAYVEPSRGHIKRKRKDKKGGNKAEAGTPDEDDATVAKTQVMQIKASKTFMLPTLTRQMTPCSTQGVKKMLQKFVAKQNGDTAASVVADDMERNYNDDYIKIFGSIKEVNEVLDEQLERHMDTGHTDAWLMLSIFRGHIDTMIQFASERDLLCPFLLSMAPCVSLKYWKEASQLYLAQIDRLVAKSEEHKIWENRPYGGPTYRKAATLLSVHDVKGAVDALADARLFKEAYILCRTRYMDSIADQILHRWAEDNSRSGIFSMAAICYVALGNMSEAANVLSNSKEEDWLSLAAEMAKIAGHSTFADHISVKREQIKNNTPTEVEEEIEKLPSRIELLMKQSAAKEAGQGDVDGDDEDGTKHIVTEDGHGDIIDDASNLNTLTEVEEEIEKLPSRIELLMKQSAAKEGGQGDVDGDDEDGTKHIVREAGDINDDASNMKEGDIGISGVENAEVPEAVNGK